MDEFASTTRLIVDVSFVLLIVWFFWLVIRGVGRRTSRARTVLLWIAWVVCVSLWIWCEMLTSSGVRQAARRAHCANQMSQIGKALANYESVHRRFPPAYSTDKDGRPLHSWRVLLLPYLEHESFYRELRLDEPWNSPHNRAVFDANGMPSVFGCPKVSEAHKQETNYVMVVGPGTISDGPHSVGCREFTDGVVNTIMVVEMADSGIHWAEPRDLKAGEMSYRINDPDEPSISSRHQGGAHVVFADGTVRFLEESTDPETLEALTTLNGGENVSEYTSKWAERFAR